MSTRPTAARAAVIIFVKAPQPGHVKTRLIPGFGAEGAAALYRAMAEDMLERLSELKRVRMEIRFTPARDYTLVRRWLGIRRRLVPQRGADLGSRMLAACRAAFRDGSDRCVIVGSDVPELSAGLVDEALEKLARHDLVLGPSRDGGYYLMGMRKPLPALLTAMPWSTAQVYEETLRRARGLGLSIGRLRRLADIDTPEDVSRLARRLRARRGARSRLPRVAAWLRGVGARE